MQDGSTIATLDGATWAALALTLTLIGAVSTVLLWRRRGVASGLRAAAWTLVPVAAWLTGTLRLAVAVADEVARWAARLVFSPVVWAGVVVAGLSAGLFVLSGVLRRRGRGGRPGREPVARRSTRGEVAAPAPPRATPSRRQQGAAPADDDMAEIEAILKKHGI